MRSDAGLFHSYIELFIYLFITFSMLNFFCFYNFLFFFLNQIIYKIFHVLRGPP